MNVSTSSVQNTAHAQDSFMQARVIFLHVPDTWTGAGTAVNSSQVTLAFSSESSTGLESGRCGLLTLGEGCSAHHAGGLNDPFLLVGGQGRLMESLLWPTDSSNSV